MSETKYLLLFIYFMKNIINKYNLKLIYFILKYNKINLFYIKIK